jgi:ParB family chromosome partitioning protein
MWTNVDNESEQNMYLNGTIKNPAKVVFFCTFVLFFIFVYNMSDKKNKPRTGRGLDALLGGVAIELTTPGHAFAEPMSVDNTSSTSAISTHEIDLDLIDTNPWQPRTHFEEEAMTELAQSVRELGIITPITVRRTENDRYQIISGERRFKAASMANLTQIPAYVMDADDRNMQILALVENIQREDLNPIDIAAGFQDLVEKYNLTQEKISEIVGKPRASITNYLRLLKLPPEIQNAVRTQVIAMGHAKVLMGLDNAQTQKNIAAQIVEHDLSVRQVEDIVKTYTQNKSEKPADKPQSARKESEETSEEASEETQEMLLLLKEIFDRNLSGRTAVKYNANGTARITIDINTSADIQFMLTKLTD